MQYTAVSYGAYDHAQFETFADANAEARRYARTTGLAATIYRGNVVLADVHADDRGTVIR